MVIAKGARTEWRLIRLSHPSVFQNLALEEALARSSASTPFVPVIRLWRNPPSVIVGRFQDVAAEVDVDYCERSRIAIARRFTGGGAVFHDYGSLNITIVMPRSEPFSIKELYERNAALIIDVLAHRGVKGEFVPPNSIYVNAKKISGAAAAVSRSYVFWHASLLVSTDTLKLKHALAPSSGFKRTNSIRSRWHPVTTLTQTLGEPVDDDLEEELLKSCSMMFGSRMEQSELLDHEIRQMEQLYEEKYSLRDWNWNQHWSRGLGRKVERAHTTIAV